MREQSRDQRFLGRSEASQTFVNFFATRREQGLFQKLTAGRREELGLLRPLFNCIVGGTSLHINPWIPTDNAESRSCCGLSGLKCRPRRKFWVLGVQQVSFLLFDIRLFPPLPLIHSFPLHHLSFVHIAAIKATFGHLLPMGRAHTSTIP